MKRSSRGEEQGAERREDELADEAVRGNPEETEDSAAEERADDPDDDVHRGHRSRGLRRSSRSANRP